VSELQALLTGWLTELAAVLPFGFAFGVGMMAAVNPCGFARLPAYLSLYLGTHEQDVGKRLSINLSSRPVRPCSSTLCRPWGSS
jgi:cytochrome c-type biogenesis protein